MKQQLSVTGTLLIALLLLFAPAHASNLADVLPSYLLIELSNNTFFVAGEDGVQAIEGLNQTLASQLTTLPLGSSSAGMVYVFDPAIGAATRAGETLGPFFAERALTVGKNRWNAGLRFSHSKPQSIDGLELDEGSLTYHLKWTEGVGAPGDLVQIRYGIDTQVSNLWFFASYGPSKKSEVGIVLPLARVDMDTSVGQRIFNLSGSQGLVFPDGSVDRTVESSDSASGLGDVILRGKYRFWGPRKNAIAGLLDIRLPTGDDSNFLGTGVTQVRAMFVGSGEYGRFSPHLNLAYTGSFGSSDVIGDLPEEVNSVIGCDFGFHARVTASVDWRGRYLVDATRVRIVPTEFPGIVGEELPQLTPFKDDVALSHLQAAFRVNVAGASLLSLGVMVPLSDEGLKSSTAIVFGFDQAF